VKSTSPLCQSHYTQYTVHTSQSLAHFPRPLSNSSTLPVFLVNSKPYFNLLNNYSSDISTLCYSDYCKSATDTYRVPICCLVADIMKTLLLDNVMDKNHGISQTH